MQAGSAWLQARRGAGDSRHLHGQLARRHEDEDARALARPPRPLRRRMGHGRQQVRERLAAAGRCAAEQVVPCERGWPGLRLHGRGTREAEVEHRAPGWRQRIGLGSGLGLALGLGLGLGLGLRLKLG